MNADRNAEYARTIDCGDGVPFLTILHHDLLEDDELIEDTAPILTARVAAIAATIIGQLGIAVTILLGGNPVIGGFAALMMMICGLALALAQIADIRQ